MSAPFAPFAPGSGWREVDYGYELEGHEHITWDSTGLAGGTARMWVREVPVPPLPTEPYTVIRAWWKNDPIGHVLLLLPDSTWFDYDRDRVIADDSQTTSFEVLSEPRAVTAKAVLDRLDALGGFYESSRAAVAREFGVVF